MNDVASTDANIHQQILDLASEAFAQAVLICDRNDEILYASRYILSIFPIPPHLLKTGTRLREFLGAVYDTGTRQGTALEGSRRRANRDEWISEQISCHWRERHEVTERIGRQRWIAIGMRRMPSGTGFVMFQDISEQKKREEQLHVDFERVTLTEAILDEMSNPICVKDRNLNYVAVNKAFCAIHGLTAESVLGRSVWDLLDADFAETFEKSDRRVLETGERFATGEQIVCADGSDLWVVTTKFRIGAPGRHLVVTVMNDVTPIVWHDGETAGPGEKALSIRDYEAFVPAQNCYDPFRSLDRHMLAEAAAMTAAPPVSDLRILLHTPVREMEIRILSWLRGWGFEAVAVRSMAEQSAFETAAAQAGLPIDLLLVHGDGALSAEALISWETSPGLRLDETVDADRLHADILDICTATAVAAPAVVAVEPHEWAIALSTDETTLPPMAEIDVLVVEDNQINQFVFSQILESLGLSYRIASTGEEAVDLWRKLSPRLVLMDVTLPGIDGCEAARRIRAAEPPLAPRTPIVAVLNQTRDDDEESVRAAGMDEYIMKPVSPDMIETMYHKHVPKEDLRLAC